MTFVAGHAIQSSVGSWHVWASALEDVSVYGGKEQQELVVRIPHATFSRH